MINILVVSITAIVAIVAIIVTSVYRLAIKTIEYRKALRIKKTMETFSNGLSGMLNTPNIKWFELANKER